MDDHGSILENATIRRLWPPTWLNPPANGETVGGRPVLNFTFALNYAAGGTDVRGYRLLNLCIHGLAALTLFGLVRRTLSRSQFGNGVAAERTDSRASSIQPALFALAVALCWLLHPLQTASVTYVVQRAESLCGLFYLLTLYAFLRGTESALAREPSRRARQRGWLGLSLACCLLGMGTKEVMSSAPLVVMLCDRAFVAGSFAAAWRIRRTYYLALASTWLALLLLVLADSRRGGSAGFGADIGGWTYALTQCRALVLYLKQAFWPVGQVFDHGTPTVASLHRVAWEAGVVLLLLALTVWALVRRPRTGTLGAAFFLILAPSSSFVPVATQTMAEHRMYLPLAALLVLIGAAVRAGVRFLPRWGGAVSGALAAGAIVALGGMTVARNRVYRSEVTLWSDTVAKRPDNPRAHYNLGLALAKSDRTAEAAAAFQRAVALQPNHAFALFQLGKAALLERRWPEAARYFEAAVAADPDYADARVNLGQALGELGKFDEAIAHFEAALALEPGAADVQTNLASALIVRGRTAEAERLLRAALATAPALAEAHYHLGTVLAPTDAAAAEREFAEAIRLRPELTGAHVALGNLLARQRRLDAAMAAYGEALRREPDHVQARNNLANCQLVTGRVAEAIANYERVLRLRPGDPTATRNLALAREQPR